MKRILFIIPSLEVGGTVSALAPVVRFLKQKFIVSIFALDNDARSVEFDDLLLPKNRLLHCLNCSFSKTNGMERIVAFLIKLLKRFCTYVHTDIETYLYRSVIKQLDNYDVVVGFQEGNATKFASLFKNADRFAWVHCDYSNYPLSGKELHIYDRFSQIVCVSQYTAQRFKEIYPSLRLRVSHIHNLLNIERIRELSKAKLDSSLLEDDVFTIISVGRLHKVKRFNLIPQIARSLKDRDLKFRWLILGPHYDDEIYHKLLREIEILSVADSVKYLGSMNNPYPYFLTSDLLVSLSSTEACPMIFNESKVLGLPILTTDFGSSYEFVDDKVIGRITDINHIEEMLAEFISNPQIVDRMKTNILTTSYNNNSILTSLQKLFQ